MNKVDKSGFASERLVLFFNLGYEEANRCNEVKWLFCKGMQKKKFKAHYVFKVAINFQQEGLTNSFYTENYVKSFVVN